MDKLHSGEDLQKAQALWTNEHFTKLNENLQKLFEDQLFCDITLISSDDEYKIMAHKNILASVSNYFLAMFGGSLCESAAMEVKLNQIDGCTLKLVLNFIYKGVIELTIDTVEPVLVGSHLLELSALENLCCAYIKENVDVSNCQGIACLAKLHNYSELHDAALAYACEHFVELRDEDEFYSQDIDQLCELISNDNLRMASEADVFQSVMAWINYKKVDRAPYLEKLLSYVRFPLLSPTYIGSIFAEVGESTEMTRIICKALVWHAVPDMRPKMFSHEQSKIRNFKDVIVAINGCDSSTGLSVGLYYSGLKEWIYTKWPAIPYRRENTKFTIVGKSLIIAGGDDKYNFSNRVDCLNLDTLEWEEFPLLNISRPYVLMTSKGAVYAFDSDSCNKLAHPFKEWKTIEIDTECPVLSMSVYDIFQNEIYFLNSDYFSTYDIAEHTANFKKIRRVSSDPLLGLHIIRHLLSDYLIEINLHSVYVYDLQTATCVIENTNISILTKDIYTALHAKSIIIYGENQFYEYDPFKNEVTDLPLLSTNYESVEVLLTNNNHGILE